MIQHPNTDLECGRCKEPVTEANWFCPHCGSLFEEKVYCANHKSVEADGVCVICANPCCNECGGFVNRVFLCDLHCNYEIQEGMARVFGDGSYTKAQLVTQCLDQGGFHPFGQRIVFVPFSEVLEAEKLIQELEVP